MARPHVMNRNPRAKWNAAVPDTVDGFVKGVGDEPKDAADFAKEIAPELTDALHNRNRMMRVCHGQGKLPHFATRKRRKEMYFLAPCSLPVR